MNHLDKVEAMQKIEMIADRVETLFWLRTAVVHEFNEHER